MCTQCANRDNDLINAPLPHPPPPSWEGGGGLPLHPLATVVLCATRQLTSPPPLSFQNYSSPPPCENVWMKTSDHHFDDFQIRNSFDAYEITEIWQWHIHPNYIPVMV